MNGKETAMTKFEMKLAARGQKALEADAPAQSKLANKVVRVYYRSQGGELLYIELLATWQQVDRLCNEHDPRYGRRSMAEGFQSFDKDDMHARDRVPLRGSRLVQLPSQYVDVLAVIPGDEVVADNNLALTM